MGILTSWLDSAYTTPSRTPLSSPSPSPSSSSSSSSSSSTSSSTSKTSRPRKKLPMVAVYVSGAAFAITLGLTALVIPHARKAFKHSQSQIQAQTHAQPQRGAVSRRTLSKSHDPSSSRSRILQSSTAVQNESYPHEPEPEPEPAPEPQRPPTTFELESAQVSPFLGIQALGIATSLVLGSAGLGVWVVSKLLGVSNMEEFTTKMREGMKDSMPVLVESVNNPKPRMVDRTIVSGDQAGRPRFGMKKEGNLMGLEQDLDMDEVGGVVDGWFNGLDEEMEPS